MTTPSQPIKKPRRKKNTDNNAVKQKGKAKKAVPVSSAVHAKAAHAPAGAYGDMQDMDTCSLQLPDGPQDSVLISQDTQEQKSVIINNADIATTAVRKGQYPDTGWPEVAFVGKSNVGKSSLINSMLGRKRLARTSGTPGKTRTINFFHVESKMYFADLPGYGYARISKSESEKWGEMVDGYLQDRPQLKRIFLLVDIRHEPGEHDKMLYEWCMHYNLPFTLVATKSDKLKRSQVPKHLAIIRRAFGAKTAPVPFSSQTKDGRDALWRLIMDSCGVDML